MKQYLRIDSGIAVEPFETDGDITQMFHPSIIWIEITYMDPVPQVGWLYDGVGFSEPEPPYIDPRPEILAELRMIDQDSARPLRALIVGAPDIGAGTPERDELEALELRYQELRAQLESLPPSP